MSTTTVSLIEILWTVSAVPGLVLWATNFLTASSAVRAVRGAGGSPGPLLWAKFSMQLTAVFVGVEVVFVILGVIAMTRVNNPQSTTVTAWLTAGSLILASVGISYLAARWRAVDKQLVGAARARRLLRHTAGDEPPR